MRALAPVLVLTAASVAAADSDDKDKDKSWLAGDHATGDWGGVRDALGDRGISIDAIYATEVFSNLTGHRGTDALGHIDLALTLDTEKLGLWPGGTFYILGQNGHGTGINADVGSATQISNLEADPYTQLTELFYEQTIDRVKIRVGKQDANRDFGTPRFGGNFINNNFGMFPTSPLPSYPTTGLGALISVQPVEPIVAKVAIYEGNPGVGGLGLDTAFKAGSGFTAVAGGAVTHHFGSADRDGGTTSLGAWRQTGQFMELDVPMPRTFDTDAGFFVQNDERIYAHPGNADDQSGLTWIVRFGWARPDRTLIARYGGTSLAWHGLGWRGDDTVGIAVGYLTVAQPLGGTPGARDEVFGELFYKWRVTPFASLQPDVGAYHQPGGDGPDALFVGIRFKAKL